MKIIYVSGVSGPCSGLMGVGAFILSESKIIWEIKERLGEGSAYLAEYHAIEQALLWCASNEYKSLEVFCNNRLVVNQLNGSWTAKSDLIQCCMNIQRLRQKVKPCNFYYLKRDSNPWMQEAYRIAREAITDEANQKRL